MSLVKKALTLSDHDFSAISKVVYDHCGINLQKDKKELVRSRLQKMVHEHNCQTYGEYLERILQNTAGPDFIIFINRLSTNLTSFFREQHHFDYLKDSLIPELYTGSSAPRIRAWSAGCSTGEEPYSLAMTIAHALPDMHQSNIRILASDISTSVLNTASKGEYGADRVESIPAPIRNQSFNKVNNNGNTSYQIKPALRKMLIFKHVNLMTKWPFTTPLDFIFCRNVMIYFDNETKEKLIQRYTDALKPGGHLFIGHSESLSNIQHDLKYVGPTIYQKQ